MYLKKSYKLSNGCYLETDLTNEQIHEMLYVLIEKLGHNKDELEITFAKSNKDVDYDETEIFIDEVLDAKK